MFGDFRSACHGAQLRDAAKLLHTMHDADAMVAYGYADGVFEESQRIAWYFVETLEWFPITTMKRFSIPAAGVDTAGFPGNIEDASLRAFLECVCQHVPGRIWLSWGEGRVMRLGASSSFEGLGRWIAETESDMFDRAAQAASETFEPWGGEPWLEDSVEPTPSGMLPMSAIGSPEGSKEIWWLVCNGARAGTMIHARYGYFTIVLDEDDACPWYELLGRTMATLCDRAVELGAVEDVNLAARRAFWNALAGPSSFVSLW